MRRTAAALALLLATAPVASATEIIPEAKPEIRVVEGTAPAIRQDIAIAPADAHSTKAARTAQMDRESWTIVLVALAVIAVTLLFF